MPEDDPNVVTDEVIELRSGQEWRSKGLRFEADTTVLVRAEGTGRFYAGFFSREVYFRKRRDPDPFPFTFGTDRSQYTTKVTIEQTDYYYVVLRVGVFSDKSTIHLEITVE